VNGLEDEGDERIMSAYGPKYARLTGIKSETQMLQTSMSVALELQISKTVTLLTIVGISISGALCILGTAIFLLHQ
jgi:hypothetical protein